ncbi:MAG: PIN domain-containing protein [Clostridiales bacterium]|jgi:tRNA(fMet)-specific endonuclease VapC|nr:PIN domain-containing protein [Clostridiales bacterium]
MIYALDTNTVAYALKGEILGHIKDEAANCNDLVIPPIVSYETKRWLLITKVTKRQKLFSDLCQNNQIGIIDRGVLDEASDIYTSLKLQGRLTDDANILIAAFCRSHDYTLVTHNLKHFQPISNLKLVDWKTEN